MGGYGSTRWAGHRRHGTVEESHGIRVAHLRGCLKDLGAFSAMITWPTLAGCPVRSTVLTFGAIAQGSSGRNRSRALTLRTECAGGADWTAREQATEVVGVPMRYGGFRWWFLCPQCLQRVSALYLPALAGARWFGCRRCYGLRYLTQRLEPVARLQTRMRRAAIRLHGQEWEDWFTQPPPKPRWMHWATYERRVRAWEAASEAEWEAKGPGIERFCRELRLSIQRRSLNSTRSGGGAGLAGRR